MAYCAYLRKSTDREDMQVQSIEIQQEWISYASSLRGKPVEKAYEDRASAKKPDNRPDFTQLLKEIEKGKWEGIYCISLDRLARNMPEAGRICWALQTGMIKEIITRDATYIPSTDTLILSMHFGISTQYSRTLSAKTSDGMNKSAKDRGKWVWQAPSGYKNTIDHKTREKFVEKDDTFPLVQQMFKLALSGKTQKEIADTIYEEGLKSKRSFKKLSKTGVSGILRNQFYCGMVRDLAGQWYEGEHEPAINKDEFEAVQKLINRKYVKQKKIFPFRGLLKCGECSSTITSQIQKGHVYYNCNKKGKPCSQKFIREEGLNSAFEEYLEVIEIPDDLKEIGKQAIIDQNRVKKYLVQVNDDQINRKRQQINSELDELLVMRRKKEITSEQFISSQAELEKDLEDLNSTQSKSDSLNAHQLRISGLWLELLESLSKSYKSQQFIEKGIMLNMIGSNWILKDGKVACIQLKPSFETALNYPKVMGGSPLSTWLELLYNSILKNIDEIELILSRLQLVLPYSDSR